MAQLCAHLWQRQRSQRSAARFKLFARAADAATSQTCAAILPDDAKSVVYNGAALLGRDACAVSFLEGRGDVAEISIDGFRLGLCGIKFRAPHAIDAMLSP